MLARDAGVRALRVADRPRVRAFAVISVLVLAAAAAVRISAPSPFAPRVHVRWTAQVDSTQRAMLERQLSLEHGQARDNDTWEYDLTDVSPASISALIAHPGVADTHYIDRTTGSISSDAPVGTVPLGGRRLASAAHSLFFDWLLLFLASSVVVSGVWLASAPNERR